MRRFRWVLVAVAVLAVLGGVGGVIALYATGGAVAAADRFFATIGSGGAQAAYDQAAPSFRASSSEADFVAAAERLKLASFASASWSRRTISGDTADLEGTLTLAGGAAVPVTMELSRDAGGVWRVAWLQIRGGIAVQAPAVPDASAAQKLAQVSLMQLVEAIHGKDFRGLWAAGSADFRKQFTPDQLAAQFQPFVDRNVDLTSAETTPVVITGAPALDKDGVLNVAGYLPAPGQNWYFQFGYEQEGAAWNLVSVSFSTKPG